MNQSSNTQAVESVWTPRGELDLSRPLVMGILNVTPDSFSDGGQYVSTDDAVEHALSMITDGADIVDIGGESTRPGAKTVSVEEELQRVIPIVKELRNKSQAIISVDTMKSKVASEALDIGADFINDVSAGLYDEQMIPLMAERDAGYILMHMRQTPQTMQESPEYDDVVDEVGEFLYQRRESCRKAGIKPQHLLLDPGIGFGKTVEHNLALLTDLNSLTGLGSPILIGVSRKNFIAELDNVTSAPKNRLGGSLAAAIFAVERGASIIRVHDVRETAQALNIIKSLLSATPIGKVSKR